MDRIGRYRIKGEMGRGAMGVVLRANDPAIGRDVAIKTIRLEGAEGSERHEKLKERLFREARSAGVLSHPNIVTIYDMGETDGCAFIAMAFVNGPSLEKLMSGPEALPGSKVLSILRQTAGALDYAHSRGVVHRDIKPANIMTDEDGSVKITDFGIARIGAQDSNEPNRVMGTPNYMSPEQVQGLDLDGRTDQFSLAVVAWEILTGERPFAGNDLSTVVYRIVSDDPPAAHRLNGTLSPEIDQVLRRALSKDPADRFANCSRFIGALDTACATTPGWKALAAGTAATMPTVAIDRPTVAKAPEPVRPVPAPVAIKPETPPTRPAKRQPGWLWPILAGSAFAAVLLGGFAYLEQDQAEPPTRTVATPNAPAPSTPEPPPIVEQPVAKAPAEEPATTRPEEPPVPAPTNPDVPPPAKLQDIWVRSVPSDTKVVLDDKLALSCQTPCVLHAYPGTHHLTFSKAGYMNEYRETQVGQTSLDLPAVTMRQPLGTLMLSTVPAGASITLNGERLDRRTPAELPLKPGDYTVTVERNGVQRTEKVQMGQSPHYMRITLGN